MKSDKKCRQRKTRATKKNVFSFGLNVDKPQAEGTYFPTDYLLSYGDIHTLFSKKFSLKSPPHPPFPLIANLCELSFLIANVCLNFSLNPCAPFQPFLLSPKHSIIFAQSNTKHFHLHTSDHLDAKTNIAICRNTRCLNN